MGSVVTEISVVARLHIRAKTSIEKSVAGPFQVAIYAGIEPLTGERHHLKEVIQAGPTAWQEAEAVIS